MRTEERLADLPSGNGVGIELFEFVDPPEQTGDPFQWWRVGISHVCFVASDIEALSARIAARGGRVMNERAWEILPGQPYRFVYCRDPFENPIELHSHSFEQIYSNQSGERPAH
jgi:catechol 2,3-dioxygenase-like lactoylglutathione lyase family enzyme